MEQVSFTQTMQSSDHSSAGSEKNQGTLKLDGKEYSLFLFTDSESATEAVSKFLQQINQAQEPDFEALSEFKFMHITQQLVENEFEIAELLGELLTFEKGEPTHDTPLSHQQNHAAKNENSQKPAQQPTHGASKNSSSQPSSKGNETIYSSLFSLAHSLNIKLSQEKKNHKTEPRETRGREESRPMPSSLMALSAESRISQEMRQQRDEEGKERQGRQDQEREKDENQEGFSQQHQNPKKENEDKKKKTVSVGSVQAARSDSVPLQTPSLRHVQTSRSTGKVNASANSEQVGSIDNIYIRFMALMARILGQAEYEAHQLYLRIKERTDSIDVLTLLVSKINSEKGAIDWTNHEEMKQLIEKARALGVDIPEGKYSWTEDEKKLLKENIQMRKDSMEKMTQLERTDMQRFLQEASQCHQARSNVLKLLKEVMDTIIANMRP